MLVFTVLQRYLMSTCFEFKGLSRKRLTKENFASKTCRSNTLNWKQTAISCSNKDNCFTGIAVFRKQRQQRLMARSNQEEDNKQAILAKTNLILIELE